MVTTNILQRTFRIAFGKQAGTAFAIDEGGRRYLITAKHVVRELKDGDEISIENDGQWLPGSVRLVGHAQEPVDISVLAPPAKLCPDHPLPPTSKGLALGQEVFLLGFPYGLSTNAGHLNAKYPIPFVKRGIMSAFGKNGEAEIYYLDAHNNRGFSGGAVVFRPGQSNDFSVAGVISGYRIEEVPVHHEGKPTDFSVASNSGIVICWPIRYAMDLIAKAPIGFVL